MPVAALRQDLALHEGARSGDGSPTWTVQDPARNRFFRLDWLTFEILCHWELGTPERIAAAVRQYSPLDASEADVQQVERFLQSNELVMQPTYENAAILVKAAESRKKSLLLRAVHNYLFFRVPLVEPDRFLSTLLPATSWLFSRGFLFMTLLALACGGVLAARQWDVFRNSLVDTFTSAGLFSYAVALILAKLLHELGHGLAARRAGCHVPSMGVAFMVLWPIPYTDLNETWKLSDRWQRLRISTAGVAMEVLIAIWATLAWSLLPEGLARNTAFLLATTTWISTLLVNLSPFMRFDGYFALSDFLDMPNLHVRSFALARWRLREVLFAFGDPPPEILRSGRLLGLVFFACTVWVYRLVIFLGIAILVYSFFVKVLGIVLFVIEILWFVVLPVISEFRIWWRRRDEIVRSRRSLVTVTALGAGLAGLVVPLPWPVQASGMLRPAQEFLVYALEPARVDAIHVRDGQQVDKDAALITLSAMLLDERRAMAISRVERLTSQADAASLTHQLRDQYLPLQARLDMARATLRSVEAERGRTVPGAPAPGVVWLADPDLRAGTWVARNELLATVVETGNWHVDAYVDERDMRRLKIGSSARFYHESGDGSPIEMSVSLIEQDATRTLPNGALARQHGGTVSAREKDGKFFPEHSVYRVRFDVPSVPLNLRAQVWRGRITAFAEPESIFLRLLQSTLAILWREGGF